MEKIGQVAYKVGLLEGSKIHPVFHVSQLKQHVGHEVVQSVLPVLDEDGLIAKALKNILARHMSKQCNRAVTEVLVQWTNGYPEDATWEKLPQLQQSFPDFDIFHP